HPTYTHHRRVGSRMTGWSTLIHADWVALEEIRTIVEEPAGTVTLNEPGARVSVPFQTGGP
ncbi:MAG: hypothetical protein ACREDK_02250, partial [Thermoplasmata archaeon]